MSNSGSKTAKEIAYAERGRKANEQRRRNDENALKLQEIREIVQRVARSQLYGQAIMDIDRILRGLPDGEAS